MINRLSPSSVARRVACPGSHALEQRYPAENESEGAREGEAAHWVAATMLRRSDTTAVLAGAVHANGTAITSDMIDACLTYFSAVTADAGGLQELHIEEPLHIATIHPDVHGTPDCWFYRANHLYIYEFKYGHGLVEVYENWQLIEYAAGILEFLGITGITDEHARVTFSVIQPRAYHRDGVVRVWSVTASDLRGYFNNLRTVENEATKPNARCRPSPQCTYCTARHACEALQRSALAATDLTGGNVAWALSPAGIGSELRYLKRAAGLLDARINGLSEQALSLIKRGERVPHWRTEQSAGRERWQVSADEVISLGEMMGVKLSKPADTITPKQAVTAGLDRALVNAYSETPPGALRLVTDDGKQARKVFGGTS